MAFSVEPSTTASGCLVPSMPIPIATTNRWSAKCTPSTMSATRSSPDRSPASSSARAVSVASTKRRETADFDVERAAASTCAADGLEACPVAAGGELGHHLGQGHLAQQLGRAEQLVGGHRQLRRSRRSARTRGRRTGDASAAEGHRARPRRRGAPRCGPASCLPLGPHRAVTDSSIKAAHNGQAGTDGHGQQALTHRRGDVGHRHAHAPRAPASRRVELFGLVVLHVVVPLLSVVLADARDLPDGRSRAGDRHLKIHDERDNLVRGAPAPVRFRSLHGGTA